MKALRFYQLAVALLIMVNVIVLGVFIYYTAPDKGRPHGPQWLAEQVLQLDEEQTNTFLDLAHEHREGMNQLGEKHKDLVKIFFSTQLDQNELLNQDSILMLIQGIERQKITTTYEHYSDVKRLLTPDQKDNFEAFLQETLKFILKDGKPPKNESPDKRDH